MLCNKCLCGGLHDCACVRGQSPGMKLTQMPKHQEQQQQPEQQVGVAGLRTTDSGFRPTAFETGVHLPLHLMHSPLQPAGADASDENHKSANPSQQADANSGILLTREAPTYTLH